MQRLGEVAGLRESLRHIAVEEQRAVRPRARAGQGENGVGSVS